MKKVRNWGKWEARQSWLVCKIICLSCFCYKKWNDRIRFWAHPQWIQLWNYHLMVNSHHRKRQRNLKPCILRSTGYYRWICERVNAFLTKILGRGCWHAFTSRGKSPFEHWLWSLKLISIHVIYSLPSILQQVRFAKFSLKYLLVFQMLATSFFWCSANRQAFEISLISLKSSPSETAFKQPRHANPLPIFCTLCLKDADASA